MPELKLTYFNMRGRAEVARIMLRYTGRKFTDERVQKVDWPAMKPTTPLGSLPILDIDGGKTHLSQSMAINRYIAKETGLAGKDSLQQARVDMIGTTINEIMETLVAYVREPDQTKKAEIEDKRNTVLLPKVFKFLENCLEKNGDCGSFFVGNSVTIADFMAWHVLEYILGKMDNALDTFPKLKENREVVSKLPKFAEYLKNRPQTEM